eukprot:m.240387 g.240387  ORF g.240387 m.240387 type:complete len:91 (-) comp26278_c0_seq2:248-520(-)
MFLRVVTDVGKPPILKNFDLCYLAMLAEDIPESIVRDLFRDILHNETTRHGGGSGLHRNRPLYTSPCCLALGAVGGGQSVTERETADRTL